MSPATTRPETGLDCPGVQASTNDRLLFRSGFLSFRHFHLLLLRSVRSRRIFRDGDVRWLTVPPASQAGCSHDSTGKSYTWKLPKVDLLLTPCGIAVLSKARRSTDSPKSKRLVQRFFYNFISAILVAFPFSWTTSWILCISPSPVLPQR